MPRKNHFHYYYKCQEFNGLICGQNIGGLRFNGQRRGTLRILSAFRFSLFGVVTAFEQTLILYFSFRLSVLCFLTTNKITRRTSMIQFQSFSNFHFSQSIFNILQNFIQKTFPIHCSNSFRNSSSKTSFFKRC